MLTSASILTLLFLATPLDALIEMTRPEYQDVAALGEETTAHFERMTGSAFGPETLDAVTQFAKTENISRSMYAYALAQQAAHLRVLNEPLDAIQTLGAIAREFADVPEVALLAECEIGRLMVQSGGSSPDFDPTIIEIQEVYEPIFDRYTPYNEHIVSAHFDFAEECSDAAQKPLYQDFAALAVEHYERGLAIIAEIDADPDLVPDRLERQRILAERSRREERLATLRERLEQRRNQQDDLFPAPHLHFTVGIPEPASCDRAAIRALIEQDAFIDAETAESLAVHCEPANVAVAAHYLKPGTAVPWQTNAFHILSFVPDGLAVSSAVDTLLGRDELPADLRDAIVEHVDMYNLVERMTYYAGRESYLARVYGEAGVTAIRRGLDWKAAERAQRNASYFAQAFPYEGARQGLRERIRAMPDYVSEAGDHPLRDTFDALGKIGTPDDLDWLAEMATVNYWNDRVIPVWEPYQREGWPIEESRDRWRHNALGALRNSDLPEAAAHIRRLRRSDARDLFQ